MPDSINEQHYFAPHDVAGMFNVSVMTVRRWADYHKAYLSTSANPPPGEKRAFSWADVETFRKVKTWRDEGLSVEAINNRLSGIRTEAITPAVTVDSLIDSPAAQDNAHQAPGLLVAVDDLQTRLALLEASSKATAHSRRDYVQGIAVGAIGVLLFMIFLLLLFMLRHWL